MSSQGQSSLEFLAFVSMSALLLAALYGVMSTKQTEAFRQQNTEKAQRIAEQVSFQVELALIHGDGYSRVFPVPSRIGGSSYTVELFNGTSRVSWANQTVLQPSRYEGEEINITTRSGNVFRVVNQDSEVTFVAE
ncbi:MAG: hypothetical protein ABEJ64_00105 [Candidatus Nanohaloarchaea archaeon]